MSETATARHSLPNLFVGQSQKEITHNEALARIDALLHPVVEAELAAPPGSLGISDDGRCWLVANAATDAWTGKSGQIARWSGGSWRYISACEGMMLWDESIGKRRFYINALWTTPNAIADPAGGTVVDVEARIALVSILQHLRDTRAV
jgi:Protein of unknown function (DUF2793)